MKDNTLDIKTVCECNRCLGCKTLHPQVSIINLEKPSVYQDAVKFEFYAILLIEDCEGDCDCCGRKYYDYSNATMVFLTPGEIFRMNKNNTLPDKGWLLAFHPDLLLMNFIIPLIRIAIPSCPVTSNCCWIIAHVTMSGNSSPVRIRTR